MYGRLVKLLRFSRISRHHEGAPPRSTHYIYPLVPVFQMTSFHSITLAPPLDPLITSTPSPISLFPLTYPLTYLTLSPTLSPTHSPLTPSGGRVLTCHREYTFLEMTTCRLSGHYVQIKSYESGLGELFLTVFVFRHSAFLTLLVDEKRRHELLANAALDPDLEEQVWTRHWHYLCPYLHLFPLTLTILTFPPYSSCHHISPSTSLPCLHFPFTQPIPALVITTNYPLPHYFYHTIPTTTD